MKYLLIASVPIVTAIGFVSLPAVAQGEAETVKVTLQDGDLGFKELTVNGEARFEIENAGTNEHAFEIEGEVGGREFEVASAVLQPGESTVLVVGLPAGTYEAYCPVSDHREKGMAGEITFAGE